ncbi:MAG: SDR family oxidoreductase [Verrucomicrobia bacterium]|nr:SDR family oxidoreductase [Verrucomicrobiota bacterium]
MSKLENAVVTGAGSGVGRSIAIALASQGHRTVILGRRLDSLKETAALAGEAGSRILCMPCDISSRESVVAMGREVLKELGDVGILINAAGANVPRRSLEVLSDADYHAMMDTNLNGAYWCVQAFLPGMRARRTGTIVNVVSDAAKQASPKAGPAYSMSKFGLVGLTQAINAEERGNGVRACALLPGDIDTPLLDKRPAPPDAQARSRMLMPEDVAECALLAVNLPSRAIVEEILIRPR